MSSSSNHTLALSADGLLWGWGENSNSNLTDSLPSLVMYPHVIGSATNWYSVSAGNLHSMGLRTP